MEKDAVLKRKFELYRWRNARKRLQRVIFISCILTRKKIAQKCVNHNSQSTHTALSEYLNRLNVCYCFYNGRRLQPKRAIQSNVSTDKKTSIKGVSPTHHQWGKMRFFPKINPTCPQS